jgi:hypothetical protein
MTIADATGTELRFEITPSAFDSLLEFYNHVFAQMRSSEHRIIGHKSTEAESGLHELLDLCPELKLLYMVRDPRDVLVSNRRMMGQNSTVVLQHWRNGLREVQRIAEIHHLNPRVHILRYEDLVSMPEETLSRMAEFLKLDRFRIPDRLSWYGQPYIANSSFGDIRELFDTRGIGRWRQEAAWIPALAEIVVGGDLGLAGYEHHQSRIGARLAAYLRACWQSDLRLGKRAVALVALAKRAILANRSPRVAP